MSELRTAFKLDRERPPAVNAAGELEDQAPETLTYTALWYVESATGDGYNEPFVPAYPVIDAVLDATGKDVSEDSAVMAAADNAVNAEYNTANHDDGREDFGPFEG